jgi:hypothetical protein
LITSMWCRLFTRSLRLLGSALDWLRYLRGRPRSHHPKRVCRKNEEIEQFYTRYRHRVSRRPQYAGCQNVFPTDSSGLPAWGPRSAPRFCGGVVSSDGNDFATTSVPSFHKSLYALPVKAVVTLGHAPKEKRGSSRRADGWSPSGQPVWGLGHLLTSGGKAGEQRSQKKRL